MSEEIYPDILRIRYTGHSYNLLGTAQRVYITGEQGYAKQTYIRADNVQEMLDQACIRKACLAARIEEKEDE